MKNIIITVSFSILVLLFGISNASTQNLAAAEKEETSMTLSNTETHAPKYLYKIVSPEEWQKSKTQKILVTSPIDDNFIHLSTEEQLPHVAQKFWKDKDYIILTLDTKKLVGRLVHESNPGGTTLYYHLYEGEIPLDAVVNTSLVQTKS